VSWRRQAPAKFAQRPQLESDDHIFDACLHGDARAGRVVVRLVATTAWGCKSVTWWSGSNFLLTVTHALQWLTRVVGAFSDGASSLHLAAARLRYIAARHAGADANLRRLGRPLCRVSVLRNVFSPGAEERCSKFRGSFPSGPFWGLPPGQMVFNYMC
jgi:hypothetical protein